MARPLCPQQPGVPLHVVLRGDPAEPGAYLEGLGAAADCPVHAYVLMGTHIHVLLTPQRVHGAMPLIHALNAREFDASPVYTRRHILACMRYIELNPVRAGIVADPRQYPWSSCRYRLGEDEGSPFDPDPCYLAIGNTLEECQANYAAFLAAGIRRHVSFEIDHIEWLENLVRRGLAAGIVPISTAQRLSALVSIPIEDGPRRQVYCIWPQPLSNAAARFLQFSGIDLAG